jgi:hypothetical protein
MEAQFDNCRLAFHPPAAWRWARGITEKGQQGREQGNDVNNDDEYGLTSGARKKLARVCGARRLPPLVMVTEMRDDGFHFFRRISELMRLLGARHRRVISFPPARRT